MKYFALGLTLVLAIGCKPLRSPVDSSSTLQASAPEGYTVEALTANDIEQVDKIAKDNDRSFSREQYDKALLETQESRGLKVVFEGKMVGYMLTYQSSDYLAIQDIAYAREANKAQVQETFRYFLEEGIGQQARQAEWTAVMAKLKGDYKAQAKEYTELGFRTLRSPAVLADGSTTGDYILAKEYKVLGDQDLTRFVERFLLEEGNKTLNAENMKSIVDPKLRAVFESTFEDVRKKFRHRKPISVDDPKVRDVVLRAVKTKQVSSGIILGNPGTGKTTALYSVMYDIMQGKYAGIVAPGSTIVMTTASQLAAGTKYRGTDSDKVQALKQFVEYENANGRKVILGIDELPTLLGTGRSEGNSTDFFAQIKDVTSTGGLVVMGTGLPDAWREVLNDQPDLERRFPSYHMPELTEEEIYKRFREWVTQNNIQERFWTEADWTADGKPKPSATERELYKLVTRFQKNKEILNAMVDMADQIQAENAIQREVYGKNPPLDITPEIAVESAKKLLQIDEAQLGNREALEAKMEKTRTRLLKNYVGVDGQIEHILRKVKTSFLPRANVKGPLMKIHLDGTPGTAKTEIAMTLAEEMGFQAHVLKGGEYGENTSKSIQDFRQELEQALRNKAAPLLIIDELEKMRFEFIQALYDVYSEGTSSGTVRRSSGQVNVLSLDFSNARIISTGNILESKIGDLLLEGKTLTPVEAREELTRFFGVKEGKYNSQGVPASDAFPRRIGRDGLVTFQPSTIEALNGMLDRRFDRYVNEVANFPGGNRLEYTAEEKEEVKKALVREFFGENAERGWVKGVTPGEVMDILHDIIRTAAYEQDGDAKFRIPSALSAFCSAAGAW